MTFEEKLDSLGPIGDLLRDVSISDIMINGTKQVYIERNGKKILTDIKLKSERQVTDIIDKIYSWAAKKIDDTTPLADVCLEDGSRVNAIIPPLSRSGPIITVRKFSREISTPEDLVRVNTFTPITAEFLAACIKGRLNIIFCGGSGVGKTTTLQIFSQCISPEERIICIEDTAELRLQQEHVISLETRDSNTRGHGEVTLRDLIRNALRMRPDRIIIGEVRGEEVLDMMQAMAVGHTGSLSIVHGNSPADVISRMETMVLMSGINISLRETRKQIASTINLLVHQHKFEDGSRKVTYVTEVEGMRGAEIILHDLFTFEFVGLDKEGKIQGELKPTFRHYPNFFQKFQRLDLNIDKIFASR